MSNYERSTQWEQLAVEAKAGRLSLDPSVSADCLSACDDLIDGLDDIAKTAKLAARAQGFGGFDSGVQLAAMYGRKGAGGPDAIDRIIREHKEVVMLIRDTINASVTRVGTQDHSSSQQISTIEPG